MEFCGTPVEAALEINEAADGVAVWRIGRLISGRVFDVGSVADFFDGFVGLSIFAVDIVDVGRVLDLLLSVIAFVLTSAMKKTFCFPSSSTLQLNKLACLYPASRNRLT